MEDNLNHLIDQFLDQAENLADFMQMEETSEGPQPSEDIHDIDLNQLKFHFQGIFDTVSSIILTIKLITAHENRVQAPTRPQE
jgi:hypothetical protein